MDGKEKVKIDLGKYDIVFEGITDNEIDISVYENYIYYKRSLSKDEAVGIINMLTDCYLK